jgi:hypothetical protein
MVADQTKPDQNVPINLAKQIVTTNYPILISEWQYLKRLINSVECSRDHFQKLGYLLIGTSLSSLVTSIKVDDTAAKNLIYQIATVVFVFGIFLIYIDNKLAKSTVYTKKSVLDQMDVIEIKFEPSPYSPEEARSKLWWQFWR